MSLFSLVLTLFLIANPIGNSPAIIALIKDFDFARQKRIMLRESLIALCLAIFFQYLGEMFLGHLHIENYSVTIAGGVLLLIVALKMIFTPALSGPGITAATREPLIVPIATPLISGPGLLTIIMIYAQQENNLTLTLSIVLAWIGVTAVLVGAPYMQKALGRRGLIALEQLMGMLLTLMSSEMIVSGIQRFLETLKNS